MRTAATTVLLAGIMILTGCGGGGSTGGGSGPISPPTPTGVQGTGGALSITTTSLPDGLTGKPYSANIVVSGGNGRLTWSISGSFFPAGLTLDATNGSISGIVGNAVLGDVTFKVTDSGNPQQVAQKTIRMTFRWAMTAVTSPVTIPAGHTGVAYKLALIASGANGNVTWALSSGQVPPGLNLTNLNSSEADLVGTPTQAGSYTFAAQATDNSTPPQTAAATVTITVDSKLAIATLNLPVPYANEPYSQTVTAVNGTPPYHWAWGRYHPYALNIDANTGVISGTPGQGNYSASVGVTDSASPANSAQQDYSMLILPRLKVLSTTLYDAHLTESYYATLYREGGQGNLAWSITSGSLPPGLTVQSQYGTISGTPTQLGTYTFTAQVQDSSTPPQTAQGQFTMNVKAAVLSLQPSLPYRIPVNVPFDGAAAARGGTPPFTFSLNAGTMPTGLSLDGSTGAVTGTPSATGYYGFTVRVTDSSSPQQTATYSYQMNVSTALGRNEVVSTATKLGNGSYAASISPLLDPPTGTVLSPDTDYYRISSIGGATVKVNVYANTINSNLGAMDPVVELLDANGARLNACRLPGDSSTSFNSACVNDDIVKGSNYNSQLEYLVPGTPDTKVDVFAHVFDWRGDARPDMTYSIAVTGAFVPIIFSIPTPPTAVVGIPYAYNTLTATGGASYLNSTISSGQLPPGLNLQGSTYTSGSGGQNQWFGYIYGMPTTAGDYTFTIQLADSGQPAQTVTSPAITIHVGTKMQIGGIPSSLSLKVGQTVTVQAQGSGGAPPYTWSVFGWAGASIDRNTGVITLTATQAGTYYFYVQANDSLGIGADSVSVSVTVTL